MQSNESLDSILNSKLNGARAGKWAAIAVAVLIVVLIVAGAVFGAMALFGPENSPAEEPPQTASTPTNLTPAESAGKSGEDAAGQDVSEGGNTPQEPEKTEYEHSILITWPEDAVPDEPVTIEIIHAGEVTGEVELFTENGWYAVWTDAYPAKEISVSGIFPKGAGASFVRDGDDFRLYGSYTPQPEVPEDGDGDGGLPQTGLVWWPAPLMAAAGAALIAVYLRRLTKGSAK